jgi:hypothetical protein
MVAKQLLEQSGDSATAFVIGLLKTDFPSADIKPEQKLSLYGYKASAHLDGLADRINAAHWHGVYVKKLDIRKCKLISCVIALCS